MRRSVVLLFAILLCSGCRGALPSTVAVAGLANGNAASLSSGKLLYVRDGAIMELSASGTRQVAKGTMTMPAWSPDGQQIAYVVRQKNNSDLALMNADGGNQTLLTHNENSDVASNLWAASPAWSPDGKRIVYSSDRGKEEPNIDLRLWSLTLATRGLTQLTTPDLQAGGDADPAFRPGHADQVVFTRWSYDSNATSAHATLVLLNLTTRARYALTPADATDFQPAWSPDGKTLAFIRRGPSGDDLYAAAVPDEVTSDVTLTATLLESGVNAQPCWSPDGTQLAYIGEDDNKFDLFTVGVTTTPAIAAKGKPGQLTTDGIDATSRPSWAR